MPELPEVQTMVKELSKKVLKRTFLAVWSDWPQMVKRPDAWLDFEKEILGQKVRGVKRKGKNILFYLSGSKILLVHPKLTGHFLLGKWKRANNQWQPLEKGDLVDPVNRFLHLIFWLDSGQMLAFSDLRKFAKVELWEEKELENSWQMQKLGPDPLEKGFDLNRFQTRIEGQKGMIKQVLMDQEIIAGIGNIYSDEILWTARINPFKKADRLNGQELKRMFEAAKEILKQAVQLGGESVSDFRRTSGQKGSYDPKRRVYRREGLKCLRCGEVIVRKKIGGRSAHFCPSCQKWQTRLP